MKKDKLKVAMFGQKSVPSREGGIEVVVENLAARMVERNVDVTCFNRGGRRKQRRNSLYKGIRLKFVPTIDLKGISAVTASFSAAICSALGPYDIVHVHAEGPAFFCWVPKLFGKKVVVTIHGLDWKREKWKGSFGSKFIHAGERAAVRFSDSIIVLSENMRDYFKQTYDRDTVYIPNGIELEPVLEAKEIRTRYNLDKDNYILFLGRLVPEKGVHYLIKAFNGLITEKHLVIAGGTSDTDEYCRHLKELAAGNPKVLFTGFVTGRILKELFSNAYIYVLPSKLEGMPISLLEAMSYGNCCVVSDLPECTEVIENKGFRCEAGNEVELTKLLQYLNDHPGIVKEYQDQTSSFIADKYSWDHTTTETIRLYRELVKKNL